MRLRLSRTPPPAQYPQIVGWLDGKSRGRLHGWAHDRSAPLRRLAVEIVDTTGHRLLALADRYRADVHQSGIGDGHYGFSLPMQRLVGRVRVTCIEPRFDLGNIDLSRPEDSVARSKTFRCGTYVLQVDVPGLLGQVGGWAIDMAHPERRRLLRLSANGYAVAQQRATLFRAEAGDAHIDAYRGYSFALPTSQAKGLTIEDVEGGLSFSVRR